MAKLLFVDQGISTEFVLDDAAGEISLGRSPTCTVRVNNPSLSRVHAVLVREGSPARYRVFDRGSSNGTYVNGQRQAEALLRHGDQLMCGEFIFLFVDDAGAMGGAESRSMPPMPSPMQTQGRMALEVTEQAEEASPEGSDAAPPVGTRSLRPLSTDAQIAQVTEDGFYAALEQADALRMELEMSQREREMLSEQVRGLMFEVNRLRSEPQTALEQAALSEGSMLGEDVVRRQSLEQMGRLRGQVEKMAAEREELLLRCRRLTELEQENRRLKEQVAAAAGSAPSESELGGRLEKMKEAFMQLDTEMLALEEVNRGLRTEVERLRGGGR